MAVKSITLMILEIMWLCPPRSGDSWRHLRILPNRDGVAIWGAACRQNEENWKVERERGRGYEAAQAVREGSPRLGNPGEGPRVERDQLPFFLLQFQFSVRP